MLSLLDNLLASLIHCFVLCNLLKFNKSLPIYFFKCSVVLLIIRIVSCGTSGGEGTVQIVIFIPVIDVKFNTQQQ